MSNFHVVRVAPVVNLTLRNKINKDKSNDELTYQAFLNKILKQHYNYGDIFSHYMSKFGNRAEEIIYDIEPLQKRWAQENNLSLEDGERWQLKIVLAQLKRLNPDIVYLQGFTRITAKDIFNIKDELPNLRKVAIHSGFPDKSYWMNQDTILFSGFPSIRDTFVKLGYEAHLLYHFFDERILENVSTKNKNYPLSFVGTSGYCYGEEHKTRYWELLKMGEKTPMNFWVDDKDTYSDPSGQGNPFVSRPLKAEYYEKLDDDVRKYPTPFTPLRNLLAPERVHAPVYGWDFFKVLANSAVTFHRHTDAMYNEIGAMRVFQATGVGSCLLSNDGVNMRELFEPDTEIVTYSSLAEGVEKANYLVQNPGKAAEIARRGQARTLKDHSATERYKLVNDILGASLNKV